jgi:antitoxin VapB
MPLNIKDEQVHEQAKLLAALTGESITTAVREAIAERLSSVRRQQQTPEPARSAERLMALAKLCASQMQTNQHSSDHSDLYGADGLPA